MGLSCVFLIYFFNGGGEGDCLGWKGGGTYMAF